MRGLLQGVADVLFPPRCPLCEGMLYDRQDTPFCEACASRIKMIGPPLCPACGQPFPTGEGTNHLCGDCILTPKAFCAARAVGYYEGALLKAIHDFKYLGNTALGKTLGKIMAEHDYPDFHIPSFTLIIPVPLHVKRLRERAFNQSLVLARPIAGRFAISLDFTALKRHTYTRPQVSLTRAERQVNVRDAFQVGRPGRIKGERIILVDDVYTTGSTLNECARVLFANGAAEVAVLTLARAV